MSEKEIRELALSWFRLQLGAVRERIRAIGVNSPAQAVMRYGEALRCLDDAEAFICEGAGLTRWQLASSRALAQAGKEEEARVVLGQLIEESIAAAAPLRETPDERRDNSQG